MTIPARAAAAVADHDRSPGDAGTNGAGALTIGQPIGMLGSFHTEMG